MIRIATQDGWLLMRHQDHARLAGEFGKFWGNGHFQKPERLEDVLVGVSRHDDAWSERDAAPLITPENLPSAFSKELVGTYSAFENIDLEAYLAVRGAATEAVAGEHPLGAILISMHTVNLLTEQADLSGLSDADRDLHARFIDNQRKRQAELKEALGENCPDDIFFDRSFRFLQACDSFSLTVCVQYPEAIPLRHNHLCADGSNAVVTCIPESPTSFKLDPWPLKEDSYAFTVDSLRIKGTTFASDEELQKACASGKMESVTINVHR